MVAHAHEVAGHRGYTLKCIGVYLKAGSQAQYMQGSEGSMHQLSSLALVLEHLPCSPFAQRHTTAQPTQVHSLNLGLAIFIMMRTKNGHVLTCAVNPPLRLLRSSYSVYLYRGSPTVRRAWVAPLAASVHGRSGRLMWSGACKVRMWGHDLHIDVRVIQCTRDPMQDA